MKKIIFTTLLLLTTVSSAMADNVYDRVMKTRTIECGYFVEPPFTIRNEVTGEFSGIAVDLIEMIANDLNLKVKWKEQMSFATFQDDLNNNKYDIVCGGIFVLPRGGRADYTNSFSYASMIGYTQPDNKKFDKPFNNVDWSKETIAGLDGEGATTAAQKLLPEAKMNVLPQLSSISEMLMLVSTGKADIGFVLPSVFKNFNETNPGKLREAKLGRPLYTYDVSFAVARNQYEFKSMINNSLRQLIASGELKDLFTKYDPDGYFDFPALNTGK